MAFDKRLEDYSKEYSRQFPFFSPLERENFWQNAITVWVSELSFREEGVFPCGVKGLISIDSIKRTEVHDRLFVSGYIIPREVKGDISYMRNSCKIFSDMSQMFYEMPSIHGFTLLVEDDGRHIKTTFGFIIKRLL